MLVDLLIPVRCESEIIICGGPYSNTASQTAFQPHRVVLITIVDVSRTRIEIVDGAGFGRVRARTCSCLV